MFGKRFSELLYLTKIADLLRFTRFEEIIFQERNVLSNPPPGTSALTPSLKGSPRPPDPGRGGTANFSLDKVKNSC